MPKQLLVSSESPVQPNPKNPHLNLHPWNSKISAKSCRKKRMLINKIPENTKQKQRKPQNEIMGRVSCTKKNPTCCQTRGACQDCDLRKNLDKNVLAAAMILSCSLSLSRNQSKTHQNPKTPPPPLSPPLAQQIS